MIGDKRITSAGIHFNHRLWMNQIAFYKTEIWLFQKRLEEITKKNSGKDVHVEIEQYQNRFIIQNNEMDIIIHKVKLHEHQISSGKTKGVYPPEDLIIDEHTKLKDDMEQFVKLYHELREDFYTFVSAWM
jgi:hypothetical protein